MYQHCLPAIPAVITTVPVAAGDRRLAGCVCDLGGRFGFLCIFSEPYFEAVCGVDAMFCSCRADFHVCSGAALVHASL